MRKDKYKWQIGDILYQASKSYKKVFEWKIVDIWIEGYLSGPKTIVKVETRSVGDGTLRVTDIRFLADILEYHDTREEAVAALAEMFR